MSEDVLIKLFELFKNENLAFDVLQDSLREICKQYQEAMIRDKGFASNANNTLSHITMGGATWRARNIVSQDDKAHLSCAFFDLLEAGFFIDPDFEIDIVNPEYGRDFLMESGKTDLFIDCGIFDAPLESRQTPDTSSIEWKMRVIEWQESMNAKKNNNDKIVNGTEIDTKKHNVSFIRSPYADIPSAFSDRAMRGNVKAVIGIDPRTTGFVSIERFDGDQFRTVADGCPSGINDKVKIGLSDLYVQAIYPFLNLENPLAQSLIAAMPSDLKPGSEAGPVWDEPS